MSMLICLLGSMVLPAQSAGEQPNIVFIMTDDHAAHAISAYGSKINKTPHSFILYQINIIMQRDTRFTVIISR